MLKKILFAGCLVCAALAGGAALAAEPTLQQVYQAAESGRLSEAQTMMDEVLQAHPDSAKAHYVEAEVLAKQGRLAQAEQELAHAERLSPGLSFAKPEAVRQLRALLGNGARGAHSSAAGSAVGSVSALQPASSPALPWGMIALGAGLIVFVVWAARFMSARNAQRGYGYPALPGSGGPTYGANPGGYGMSGGPGMAGPAGQGLGSRVLGGLATGAAVGAGIAAGEALMHRFTDDRRTGSSESGNIFDDTRGGMGETFADDMGGNDFGISDASSWDDSSGGGDWN